MKYKILAEKPVFDQFFKINKATIEHDQFDGSKVTIERLCFERGDAVAVVIYEQDTDSLLFTNQFRYPSTKEGDGWVLELTAGMLEGEEDAAMRVKKEVEEEIGYRLNSPKFISSFFVSPGGTSERIFLYYAEVSSTDKLYEGGGLKAEKEDIQLVKIKRQEVKQLLQNNQIRDAKTIIGLQWFLMR
ncbi:NUDIX hydrolase [Persicobacter psychrovividus]|uniref:GDP-mannose pyrophosphatase n=1 Tax=Persicobacter psychrovividus TaxID=387638 RepID=A0ABM7VJ01_9BACT|nr:ADP-ribose pyrophosphatase [Persicobacter psychrovividus]